MQKNKRSLLYPVLFSVLFSVNLSVFAQLSADFSYKQSGCSPDTVQFTNKSSGAVKYKWEFGDFAPADTAVNPTHIYGWGDPYIVTLTAYSAGGDSAKAIKTVLVKNAPGAWFWADPNQTCFGEETKFMNNTWPTASTAKWYFGDGDSSTKFSPKHTYATEDTFNVMLISSNECGVDTVTNQHIVSSAARPNASMSFWPNPVCPGKELNINNWSSNATSYLWTFGDGDSATTQIPTHAYSATGSFDVNLYAFNNCGSDTATNTINVDGGLTHNVWISAAPNTACPGQDIEFRCPSDYFNSFHWNFDDGNASMQRNPVHHFSTPGTYNVVITATNHCGNIDKDSVLITIDPDAIPGASFNYNPAGDICPGTPVMFENTSSDTIYGVWWDFDDGNFSSDVNPQHTFADTGIYDVSLVVFNECGNSDTAISTVFVTNNGMVNAWFNPWPWPWQPICHGTEIYFENFSAGASDYLWDFDDGTTSTEKNTSHTFDTAGFYYVMLTASNKCGNSDNRMEIFNISDNVDPYIDFGFWPNTVCMGEPVNFWNGSFAPNNSLWHFGDGDTSTAREPIHTYTSPGTFDVMLIISTNCGTDTLVQQIFIKETPQPDFNYTTVCSGTPTSFTDLTTGSTDFWAWDFGDGDTSSTQNPGHTYSTGNNFDVTLTVGKGECSNSTTKTVTVNEAVAEAGDNVEICAGGNTDLTATGGVGYNWSTGGNTQTINVSPAGDAWYYVTVTDGDGCEDIDSVEVTIGTFNVNAGADVAICKGDNTTLSATGGSTYAWTPSEGLSDTTIANPVASPDTTTMYIVGGTDGSGCFDADTVIVSVNEVIANAGTNDTICAGGSTMLNASGGDFYSWSPASLSNPNISNPVASPSSTTTYTVTVTDTAGCSDISQVSVVVHEDFADAGSDISICKGDSTVLSASGGVFYKWSTGENTQDITVKPDVNTFYLLTVTDSRGCKDYDNVQVSVKALPNANTTPDTNICAGGNIDLYSTGGTSYNWSTGDNTAFTNVAPSLPETYYVTVTGSNGCSTADSVFVDIDSIAITTLADTTSGNCATIDLITSVDYGTAAGYAWSPANGLNASTILSPSIDINALPNGINTYTITVTSIHGCTATDAVTITNDSINIQAITDTSLCNNKSITLNTFVVNGTGSTYAWSPGTGLSSTAVKNPVLDANSLAPGMHTYTVTATDIYGCTDTDDINITVHALPSADAGADTAICEGGMATLTASGGVSYSWNTGDNTVAINVSPSTPSNYTVTVTDINGCKATDQAMVTLNSLPTANAGSDESLCIGDTITLTASGGNTYEWSTGGNTASIDISPALDTNYAVTVTDVNGCKDDDQVNITVNPLPLTDAGSDETICENEQITLTASGGNDYTWSNGKTTASIDVTPTDSIVYYVTVTDLNNCSALDSVAVHVNERPLATIIDTTMASCGSSDGVAVAGASGGTGSYNYQWDAATGSQANDTASNLGAGIYYVTVDDGLCTADTFAIINEIGAPTLTVSGDVAICDGDTTLLDVSGADSYSWSPASGLNTTSGDTVYASPGTTTTYTVQGTSGGCSTFENIKVTIHPYPVVNLGANTNVCANLNKMLDAGSGYDNYSWSTGESTDIISIDSTGIGLATENYFVTVTDNSCSTIDSIAVTYVATPVADAGANQDMCDNDTAILIATGGTNYHWNTGVLTDTAYVSPSATTSYFVTVEDVNGCTDIDTVTVNTLDAPSAIISNIVDENCGNADGEATVTPSGGTGSYTYLWDVNTGSQTDSTANSLEAGFYHVTVDDGQCSTTKNVTINETGTPSLIVSPDTSICAGDSVTLTVSGAMNYLWSPPAGLKDTTGNNVKASPAVTTVYAILGDNSGCYDTDSIMVTVKPNPVVGLGADTSICASLSSLSLEAGSGYDDYSWSTGSNAESIIVDSNDVGIATYYVTVTNNNCTTVDSITVSYVICGEIAGHDEQVMIKIYPNPADEMVNIITSGLENEYKLRLIGPQGQLILDRSVEVSEINNHHIILKTDDYPKGIYLVNIVHGQNKYSIKLIIQ